MKGRYGVNMIRPRVLRITILVIAVLLLLLQSQLAPGRSGIPGTDSAVFAYTADQMLSGRTLYVDVWEHKGPYLYLFNAVGLLIGGLSGIWFLELCIWLLSTYFFFRIACRFTSENNATVALVLVLVTAFPLLHGGNFSEEYALPFIAISLHIVFNIIEKGTVRHGEAIFIGIAIGVILLLRANMLAPFGAFAGYYLYRFFRKSTGRRFFQTVGEVIAGVALVVVPIVLWFGLKGHLADFWFAVFAFNFDYIGVSLIDKAKGMVGVLEMANEIGLVTISGLIMIFSMISSWNQRNTEAMEKWSVTFAAFVLVALSNGLSGNRYDHYALTMLPFLVPGTARFIDGVSRWTETARINALPYTWFLLIVGMMLFRIPDYISEYTLDASFLRSTRETTRFVRSTTSESDTIAVFGNGSRIYLLSDRDSASRYHFTLPILAFPHAETNGMRAQYLGDIQETKPKLWLFTADWEERLLQRNADSFRAEIIAMRDRLYTPVHENSGFSVYERVAPFHD